MFCTEFSFHKKKRRSPPDVLPFYLYVICVYIIYNFKFYKNSYAPQSKLIYSFINRFVKEVNFCKMFNIAIAFLIRQSDNLIY